MFLDVVVKIGGSHWPAAHELGEAGRPSISRDACLHIHSAGIISIYCDTLLFFFFNVGSVYQTQVIVLVRLGQALTK